MREIICDEGDLIRSEVPYKVKRMYEDYMNDVQGATHPDDLSENNESLRNSTCLVKQWLSDSKFPSFDNCVYLYVVVVLAKTSKQEV